MTRTCSRDEIYPQRHSRPRSAKWCGGIAGWVALTLVIGVLPCVARACSNDGKLFALLHYAGSDRSSGGPLLDQDPAVQAFVMRLPAAVRAHLQRNLDVRGPVDLISCHLVLAGNAVHRGRDEDAILDVALFSGAVTVAIHSGGHVSIYLDHDPATGGGYDTAVPQAVRNWAAAFAVGISVSEAPPAPTSGPYATAGWKLPVRFTQLSQSAQAAIMQAGGFKLDGKIWQGCEGLSKVESDGVEIEDLNRDGRPEVVIVDRGCDCYLNAGNGFTVLMATPGSWRVMFEGTGILSFRETRGADGYPDIEMGGPGPCVAVFRWMETNTACCAVNMVATRTPASPA